MYIGITERGDAGLDFGWENKLYDANILITKHVNDEFIKKVLNHKDKIIVHATITGFGGTILEPNVPDYHSSYIGLAKLIMFGFPTNQIVLRIDPIIPTSKGLDTVENILKEFVYLNIQRCRFSFLDMYPHVKQRFKENKIKLPYETFTAPQYMIDNALQVLKEYEGVYQFESCAENTPYQLGCISEKDLKILGVNMEVKDGGFQRKGCLCLGNKKELLNNKKQCTSKCLYCYWKN